MNAFAHSDQVPSVGCDGVGNLLGYVHNAGHGPWCHVPEMGSWTFSYNTLNRLAGAIDSQPNNPGTNYRWSCDPFGNRTLEAGSSQAFATNSTASSPCMPAGNASYISTWAHYSTSGNNQLTSSSQAVSGVVYDPAATSSTTA